MTWNKCPPHAALPVALGLNGDADGVRASEPSRWYVGRLILFLKQNSGMLQKMNWVKALLLLSCLIVECADLVTTNVILDHGFTELNPFMRLAQTWLGEWWLIPKLSLTFVVMWLLSRSNNLYNISLVVALCSTPVLNNLIIIAGMK